MILIALRLAGNIESRLTPTQTALFQKDGMASARLFPPLIPLAYLAEPLSEHQLDTIRRAHSCSLSAMPAGAAHLSALTTMYDALIMEHAQSSPPLYKQTEALRVLPSIPVLIQNAESLCAAVWNAAAPTHEEYDMQHMVTPLGQQKEAHAVILAWETMPAPRWQQICASLLEHIPQTDALWLSSIHIEPIEAMGAIETINPAAGEIPAEGELPAEPASDTGGIHDWWHCTWQETYKRRLAPAPKKQQQP